MKTRSVLSIMLSLLVVVLVVAGCGGSKTTTSPTTTTPTTTAPTTTAPTTTAPTTTAPTSTAPTTQPAKTLTNVAVPNTTHTLAILAAYKSIGCLFCHGPTGSNPQPYAPSWDATASASTHNTGTFVVVAGSAADHTGYTNDTDCQKDGCHAKPTS